MGPVRALILTADSETARLASEALLRELPGADVSVLGDASTLAALSEPPDVVILDIRTADGRWQELFQDAGGHLPHVASVLIGEPDAASARDALGLGVDEWIAPRPDHLERVGLAARLHLDRRRRLTSLDAGLERYRSFLELSTEGIWRMELEAPCDTSLPIPEQIDQFYALGYMAECNAAMARMYGFESAQDLLGCRLEDMLIRSDPVNTAYLESFIRSGYRLTGYETHEHDRDGRDKYIVNSLVGVVQDGKLWRAWGVQQDVTERRAAAEALRQSEELFRALFERSPLPMWMYDVESLRFLDVNAAAIAHYGYTRDEFLGMRITDIRPAEEVPALLERLAQKLTGPRRDGPWTHSRRNGELLQVEIAADDLTVAGRHARLVISHDVTERLTAERALRESQEQLRQAQKMEAMGRLAGGVAHDFNNILTAVLGYVALLEDEVSDGEAREGLREIATAGERGKALTGQLLAFSRKQAVQPQRLDVCAVIGGMAPMLERLIGEDVRLVSTLSPMDGVVMADRGQLEQVVMNLVLNARDAMPRGGTIGILAGARSLDGDAVRRRPGLHPGPHVLVEIRDQGTGMSEDVRLRAFEPFFTTKEKARGTGLGLSTVYGIVTRCGGHVEIESEPDRGTVVRIFLPVAGAARDDARPATASPPRGSETVLLAEDEETVRAVARRILTGAGYTVLDTAGGEQALQALAAHDGPVHLLLTDVVMPGMSGRDLAERVTAQGGRTRVLFMSGYTEDAVLRHGVASRAAAFLQKPFTAVTLLAKVREVLDAA